MSMNLIRLIRL